MILSHTPQPGEAPGDPHRAQSLPTPNQARALSLRLPLTSSLACGPDGGRGRRTPRTRKLPFSATGRSGIGGRGCALAAPPAQAATAGPQGEHLQGRPPHAPPEARLHPFPLGVAACSPPPGSRSRDTVGDSGCKLAARVARARDARDGGRGQGESRQGQSPDPAELRAPLLAYPARDLGPTAAGHGSPRTHSPEARRPQ